MSARDAQDLILKVARDPRAGCVGTPPEIYHEYADPTDTALAMAICGRCPILRDCEAAVLALDAHTDPRDTRGCTTADSRARTRQSQASALRFALDNMTTRELAAFADRQEQDAGKTALVRGIRSVLLARARRASMRAVAA